MGASSAVISLLVAVVSRPQNVSVTAIVAVQAFMPLSVDEGWPSLYCGLFWFNSHFNHQFVILDSATSPRSFITWITCHGLESHVTLST